jgi:hypothetical protein
VTARDERRAYPVGYPLAAPNNRPHRRPHGERTVRVVPTLSHTYRSTRARADRRAMHHARYWSRLHRTGTAVGARVLAAQPGRVDRPRYRDGQHGVDRTTDHRFASTSQAGARRSTPRARRGGRLPVRSTNAGACVTVRVHLVMRDAAGHLSQPRAGRGCWFARRSACSVSSRSIRVHGVTRGTCDRGLHRRERGGGWLPVGSSSSVVCLPVLVCRMVPTHATEGGGR